MQAFSITASRGFTLVQLIIAIAIAGILASLSTWAYSRHARDARLAEAHAALLQNAQYMERFYHQRKSFKATSTTWPALPVTETEHFCIRPQGNARGANDERYTLKAVAKNPANEPRILKIGEDLNSQICESSRSSCADNSAFFSAANGTDRICKIYRQ